MSDNASVYLDNHATTRIDPDVFESMIPWFTDSYGNAGSGTHVMGTVARDAVESARRRVADAVGATAREIVFTSGATESVNLAIAGVVSRQPSGQCVVPVTEHVAVLDVVDQLEREGLSVCRVPVAAKDTETPGALDLNLLDEMIGAGTSLVSVMFANNEIGTVHPISAIADIVHSHGALLHVDCAQAIGNCSIDVTTIGADLASFSAHKCHGPKGVGALYVRRKPRVRIEPQIHGGGHERGMRSGTLPTHQIVGMGEAYRIAKEEMQEENVRILALRNRLLDGLNDMEEVYVNGDIDHRVAGNLNISFNFVEGESLMMALRDLAVSSGSACTSASLEPSYVLRAIGLNDELAHSSLRMTVGRFTTEEEVDYAIEKIREAVGKLRELSPLWDMYKDGVDLDQVQWAAH